MISFISVPLPEIPCKVSPRYSLLAEQSEVVTLHLFGYLKLKDKRASVGYEEAKGNTWCSVGGNVIIENSEYPNKGSLKH